MDPTAQLARLESRLQELDRDMADPDLYRQGTRARDLAREHARIRSGTEAARRLVSLTAQLQENATLRTSTTDPEMRQMAEEEAAELTRDEAAAKAQVLRSILPPDPDEHRDTIVEIRAGAGGTEAAMFAGDLFRMYSRYAETRGWKLDPLSSSPSELGGLKEIVFELTGPAVFAAMRHESGVHRVQRVPPPKPKAEFTPPPQPWPFFLSPRRWNSKSAPMKFESKSVARADLAAKESTPPIPQSKSSTFPQA